MYRLILTTILLLVLYFLVRQMFRGFKSQKIDTKAESKVQDLDQMVEDPVCHTFVPIQIAVLEKLGGRDYWFCSKECAATFKSQRPG